MVPGGQQDWFYVQRLDWDRLDVAPGDLDEQKDIQKQRNKYKLHRSTPGTDPIGYGQFNFSL